MGFLAVDTSAVLVAGRWSDEGTDGTYLVTTVLQKGDKPWNKAVTTLVATVTRANGIEFKVSILTAEQLSYLTH